MVFAVIIIIIMAIANANYDESFINFRIQDLGQLINFTTTINLKSFNSIVKANFIAMKRKAIIIAGWSFGDFIMKLIFSYY